MLLAAIFDQEAAHLVIGERFHDDACPIAVNDDGMRGGFITDQFHAGLQDNVFNIHARLNLDDIDALR